MDLQMTGAGLPKANMTGAMKRRMNYLIARQGVVSGNIANASTPNYIAKDLAFVSQVQKSGVDLLRTHTNHIEGEDNTMSSYGKMTYDTTNMRDDGNSVKLDEEMLKLSDIQMNYRLVTRLYAKHAGMHKMVLQGNR